MKITAFVLLALICGQVRFAHYYVVGKLYSVAVADIPPARTISRAFLLQAVTAHPLLGKALLKGAIAKGVAAASAGALLNGGPGIGGPSAANPSAPVFGNGNPSGPLFVNGNPSAPLFGNGNPSAAPSGNGNPSAPPGGGFDGEEACTCKEMHPVIQLFWLQHSLN